MNRSPSHGTLAPRSPGHQSTSRPPPTPSAPPGPAATSPLRPPCRQVWPPPPRPGVARYWSAARRSPRSTASPPTVTSARAGAAAPTCTGRTGPVPTRTGSTTLQPRLGGADQDATALLAPHHLVRCGGLDRVQVHGAERDVAALAPAAAQHRRTRRARRADLVIQREQVGRHVRGDLGPLADRGCRRGVYLGEADVPAFGQLGLRGGELGALAHQGVAFGVDALAPLHQRQHDLFEVTLPL